MSSVEKVCSNIFNRSLRFRWHQGFIPEDDFAPEWAIDNLFIGMACMEHCLGHGVCTDMMSCQCDDGYHGDMCMPSDRHPTYLKDDFSVSSDLYVFSGRGDLKPIESIPDCEFDFLVLLNLEISF